MTTPRCAPELLEWPPEVLEALKTVHRLEAASLKAWVELDRAALAELRVRRRAAIARLEQAKQVAITADRRPPP